MWLRTRLTFGIDFADAREMFNGPMLVNRDRRRDYGEVRQIGFGYVQARLMAVAFTERLPDVIRIISLRKAKHVSKPVSRQPSQTDWAKVDAMTDEEIDYAEIPEQGDDFFATATLRLPRPKATVTLRLDRDLLDWLKAQGKGYQTRINAILRTYMESQKARAR